MSRRRILAVDRGRVALFLAQIGLADELVEMSAVGLSATLLDVQNGLLVRTRHTAAEPFQVRGPELPHDVGQFDCHRRSFQTGRVMIFSMAWRTCD